MQPPQNPYNQPGYGQPNYGGQPGYSGQPRGTVSLDVIGEAWNLVKPSLGQWIVAFLIVVAVAVVFNLLTQGILMAFMPRQGQRPGPGFYLAFLLMIPYFVVIMALSAGLIKMAITQVRTGVVSIRDLTSVTGILGPVIVAALLVGIITNIGYFLCIVPGVIASLGLCMVLPLVIDQQMGAIDAMKLSWEKCKPHLGSIFVLGIVLYLLNIAGMIPCGLGLFVTYPISIVALALVYRDLFGVSGTLGQNTGYTPPPIANPNF